jgi:hypothetical protein
MPQTAAWSRDRALAETCLPRLRLGEEICVGDQLEWHVQGERGMRLDVALLVLLFLELGESFLITAHLYLDERQELSEDSCFALAQKIA